MGPDALADVVLPIFTTFGLVPSEDRAMRRRDTPEFDAMLGAYDDGAPIGGLGSFTFELTVPSPDGGKPVETAGTTMVGVLPTHRRRGVLRGLMRRYLDDVHQRGQVLSALFASEAPIYSRFGYGMASVMADVSIERDRSAFVGSASPPGRVRLVGQEEAERAFPPIWDKVRRCTPGMLSRSAGWWRRRRLDEIDWQRGGRGLLQRALLEIDGQPAAYALYRHVSGFDEPIPFGAVHVVEALGASPPATRAIWRYLLDIDMVHRIKAQMLPIDHPLLFLIAEPRRLWMHLSDGLWVRLVDVAAALSARGFEAAEPLVLAVSDAFCPWNEGRYVIKDGAAQRSDATPDVALDVEALGAAYLGAFSFTQLAEANRVTELREGALRRADALFRATRAPWCPEQF